MKTISLTNTYSNTWLHLSFTYLLVIVTCLHNHNKHFSVETERERYNDEHSGVRHKLTKVIESTDQ